MFKIVSNSRYTIEKHISHKIKSSIYLQHISFRHIFNKIHHHEQEPIKEKYIVIMKDKYSVKPDKEIKITKTSQDKYGKINLLIILKN
jgi:hypothetical protein